VARQADLLVGAFGRADDYAILTRGGLDRDVAVQDILQDGIRVALQRVPIAATTG